MIRCVPLLLTIAILPTPAGEVRPDLFAPGLARAEMFRQRLLAPVEHGPTRAEALADAIVSFRDRAGDALEDRDLPDLSGFSIRSSEIAAAIRGDGPPIQPDRAFGRFSGKWFGRWDGRRVDHDWSSVSTFDPPLELDDESEGAPPVIARQFAWIGDGFGWNVIARTPDGGEVVLGTVYHVEDGDPDRVRLHRPHVGVALEGGRLIWITSGEVFFEEILPGNPDRYAITGFFYTVGHDGRIVPKGDAFRAVYTRSPEDRPAFLRFPVDRPRRARPNT